MPIDLFFESSGLQMKIERNGEVVFEAIGLPNREKATKRQYIGFRPGVDVKAGDVIVNPAGERLHIMDTQASFFQKELQQIKCYYLTEHEYAEKNNQTRANVFNIGNAYGSIIGTDNVATINYETSLSNLRERVANEAGPDHEQMEKLVNLLQMVIDGEVPAQKGLLSKFSATMERHSWLSSAVASTLLTWLMQFPH